MIDERDERICRLLLKRIIGKITEEEARQLEEWRKECSEHERLYSRLQDIRYIEKEYRRRKLINTHRPEVDMQRRIQDSKRTTLKIRWGYWTAVASVAFLLCFGMVGLWMSNSDETIGEPYSNTAVIANIKPGEKKATLMLADGEVVRLGADEKANVHAMAEHKMRAEVKPAERYLSLDVPRGGEFKIVLEDSTEVWLNSESKLIYPESFSKEERRVVVSGEAYFKVAKEKSGRPFLVETDGQLVRVHGTEFNIRSYAEDEQVYTTLVEGSISIGRLSERSGELLLTPGHQVLFDKDSKTTSVKSVNTDVVTSWREGRFVFEDQNLEQIMRILSRWYAFDFRFEEEDLRNIIFMGSIPRYSEFVTVLALLEKSGGLKFSLHGSTVIIDKEK